MSMIGNARRTASQAIQASLLLAVVAGAASAAAASSCLHGMPGLLTLPCRPCLDFCSLTPTFLSRFGSPQARGYKMTRQIARASRPDYFVAVARHLDELQGGRYRGNRGAHNATKSERLVTIGTARKKSEPPDGGSDLFQLPRLIHISGFNRVT
jgi:hypothetical protein